jgi:HD-GYP domain-containing protein (c-di-GMP phosphodiesterase class II)
MDITRFKEELGKLTRIGICLTSTHDLDQLLEMIVHEARTFTGADAGSLYLREKDHLRFVVSQNDTLEKRRDCEGERKKFSSYTLPISHESIAGYSASTKENLNIPDVYALTSNLPYSFNSDFDQRNDYHTQSMLVVPMLDHRNEVLGVLQLINAVENHQVIPFDRAWEDLVRSLASQAAVAVNNARLTREIKHIHLDTIYRLSVVAEYSDLDTGQHIRRVSHYSAALAEHMGWDAAQVELLLYTSPMHDIGKIGIPDAIIKKPAKLTLEEIKIMQKHTSIGAQILSGSDSELLQMSEDVALNHHEKWDGSGYPHRLKEKNIPSVGRIVAIVDVFDALCSNRVYKGALGFEESHEIIQQNAGTHFDPDCVAAFSEITNEIYDIFQRTNDNSPLFSHE